MKNVNHLHARRVDCDDCSAVAQVAHKLAELRKRAGDTQKRLAERAGMTESMVSRLERGDHLPSLATLCRIAEALDVKRQEVIS